MQSYDPLHAWLQASVVPCMEPLNDIHYNLPIEAGEMLTVGRDATHRVELLHLGWAALDHCVDSIHSPS